jgi:hypothetical protein
MNYSANKTCFFLFFFLLSKSFATDMASNITEHMRKYIPTPGYRQQITAAITSEIY